MNVFVGSIDDQKQPEQLVAPLNAGQRNAMALIGMSLQFRKQQPAHGIELSSDAKD